MDENMECKKRGFGRIIGCIFAFIGVTLAMAVVCLYCVMWVCVNGPSEEVKELFVLSVRETSAGGFLANIYLSDEEIRQIEEENTVVETNEITDTSIVTIDNGSKKNSEITEEQSATSDSANATYIVETSYDKSIMVENGIEFHDIEGATFTGKMMVVKNPDRVFIGTPRDCYDGQPGISVPEIADRYGAIAAVNGGFFEDTGGVGDGGTPLGFVFSRGKQLYGGTTQEYNMMGFNEAGILICGRMTGAEALELGIRDGLSCDPFLVINGEGLNVSGKGGGLNPRTAVGQRADGAVLILTIDGRQATSLGAAMSDMVDVMLAFGAVNAGNLDGGGSTVLYYDKEIRNVVMSIYGARGVPDAVCVMPE